MCALILLVEVRGARTPAAAAIDFYLSISTIISTSTALFEGSACSPTAERACLPISSTYATQYIHDDDGGTIGSYWKKYVDLANAGELVVIDGDCFSSCTIILKYTRSIPICVTNNARFGFHRAFKGDEVNVNGKRIFRNLREYPEGQQLLLSFYPDNVKNFLTQLRRQCDGCFPALTAFRQECSVSG